MSFHIAALSASINRTAFDCGVPELNRYFQQYSSQHQKGNSSQTFELMDTGKTPPIAAGFYSLSMGSIELASLPPDRAKKLPKHPVPVARIGRLAVDKTYQGQKLGAHLLVDALKRVQTLSEQIGVYAVVVDAKDEKAVAFYKKFGFIPLNDSPRRLFLPMNSLPKE